MRKAVFPVFLWLLFGPTTLSWAITFYKPTNNFTPASCRFGDSWFPCKHGVNKRHAGVDTDWGTQKQVYSAAAGKIRYAGVFERSDPGKWGECVIIEHEKRITTLYGHINIKTGIKAGKTVTAHQGLGSIDLSITGSDPHLHFGIRFAPYDADLSKRGALPFTCKQCTDPRFPEHFRDPLPLLKDWREPSTPVTSSPSGITTVLVVDCSFSMTGEKIKRAVAAANSYIDTARNRDGVALVQFAETARLLCEVKSLANQANRTTLKARASKISPLPWTNPGAGLNIAFAQLKTNAGKSQPVTLLLADGESNKGDLWSAVARFEKVRWPIYAVAYGDDADRGALQRIAARTGGIFFDADTTNITQVYAKISSISRGDSVIVSYNDRIKQNQTLQYFARIARDFTRAVFLADWYGSRVDIKLRTPSGDLITPTNFRRWPNVSFTRAKTYSFFTVDKPEPGEWQVELMGAEIPKPEQVNLTISGTSPLLAHSLATTPYHNAGDRIPIVVRVAEIISGKICQPNEIEVRARVKKPSPKPSFTRSGNRLELNLEQLLTQVLFREAKIKLFDDGAHGDQNAGDGIYGGIYDDADRNGPYKVEIACKIETAAGETIERTLHESFQVGPIESNKTTLAEFLQALR